MKKIKLTKGKSAIVDNDDFEYLSQWKWHYMMGYGYAGRIDNLTKKYIKMHRVILALKKGEMGDHINCNKLDNRKCNLRKCTPSGNSRNKSIGKNNKTGFKGVYYEKSRDTYQAHITVNWKHKFLGTFDTKEEAAKAYNLGAKKYFGKFARLNVI